ncbi:MAG: hypothetical protein AAGA11_04875 [Pseudomonadota bacterium]
MNLFASQAAHTPPRDVLLTVATVAVLIGAVWLPKSDRNDLDFALSTGGAATVPAASALVHGQPVHLRVTLASPGVPVFYSLCHRFDHTTNAESPYRIDYTQCPVQRTQVALSESLNITVPADASHLIAEVWPLDAVQDPHYRILSLSESGSLELRIR